MLRTLSSISYLPSARFGYRGTGHGYPLRRFRVALSIRPTHFVLVPMRQLYPAGASVSCAMLGQLHVSSRNLSHDFYKPAPSPPHNWQGKLRLHLPLSYYHSPCSPMIRRQSGQENSHAQLSSLSYREADKGANQVHRRKPLRRGDGGRSYDKESAMPCLAALETSFVSSPAEVVPNIIFWGFLKTIE